MSTTAETSVRIGADLDSLRSGMANAEEITAKAMTDITAAINRMATQTVNAIQGQSYVISNNFSLMSQAMAQTGAAAQQTGQEITQAIQDSSRPMNDPTRPLREGAEATNSKMKELIQTIAGMLSLAAIVKVVKDSVESYQRAESAMYGLASAARYTGNAFDEVMVAAQKLSNDGLMNLSESSKGLQNLLMRGFSLQEAVELMNRFRDSAAFNRQASLQFGEAVVTATEGIKNENSVLVDNAGVTKNVSVMWKEYAQAHGLTAENLTIAQKRQAEYNGIMKETEGQVGNAAKMSGLFSGQLARMKQEAELTRGVFAQAMIPTLADLLSAMRPVLSMARDFIGGFQMMAVSIAGFVDKASALYDAGGIVGVLFSEDSRAQLKRQFAVIDQAIEEQKAEIFKKFTDPVAFNPTMLDKGTGPIRQDPKAPPKKAESRVDQWKVDLERKKELEGNYLKDSKEADLEYWEAKSRIAKKGSEEERAVAHEIFRLKKDIQKEELQSEIEGIKLRLDQEKTGSQERINIQAEAVKKMADIYGTDSKEYKAALREKEKLTREHALMLQHIADSITAKNREIEEIHLDIARTGAAQQREAGLITAEQEIKILSDLENRKAAIERAAYTEQLNREKEGTLEYQKILNAKEIAEAKHLQRSAEINRKAATDQNKIWANVGASMEKSIGNAITGMVKGTTSFRQAVQQIAGSILNSFIDLGVKMAMDWVKHEILKTTVTTAQTAQRSATTAAGAATDTAVTTTTAITGITANAGVAASGAAASQAQIPIVGPALAVAAAAAMMAMVMGFASGIGSAAGGWGQIPEDQLAMVHKDEMVLPAELAEGVRSTIGKGNQAKQTGGSGNTHITIHAVDAKSIKRLLADNGGAVTNALTRQARNFAGRKV